MFRAHLAHHQERQIVSIQPLVAVTLCRWPCCVQVLSDLHTTRPPTATRGCIDTLSFCVGGRVGCRSERTCTQHGRRQLPEVVLTLCHSVSVAVLCAIDSYQRLYWHNLSPLMMSTMCSKHVKFIPQQAEVAQGVPGSLRPRIFLTFWHYKGGRSSAIPTGRLYPRRNPWYSFLETESISGHMVLSGVPRKKSPVTPPGGIFEICRELKIWINT